MLRGSPQTQYVAPTVANHHDALFKEAFSSPESAAAELRAILPHVLARALELENLALVPGSFRSKELAESHTDLLFTVPILGKSALVYVLFEHKSFSDRWTPFQILGYMLDIWEIFRQKNSPSAFLPPIIPLVVHHSASGWTRSKAFDSLFDPNLLAIPGLSQGLPNFEFHLDDISNLPEVQLRQRAFGAFVTLAVAALSRSHESPEALLEALASFADLFDSLLSAPNGARALAILFEYVSRVSPNTTPQDLERALAKNTPKAQDIAMTIVDQLRQQGLEQGLEQGLTQGLEQGRTQGRALTLLKLLKLKFGTVSTDVERSVASAAPEQLELFLERILTASSIHEVMQG